MTAAEQAGGGGGGPLGSGDEEATIHDRVAPTQPEKSHTHNDNQYVPISLLPLDIVRMLCIYVYICR